MYGLVRARVEVDGYDPNARVWARDDHLSAAVNAGPIKVAVAGVAIHARPHPLR